MRIIGDVIEGSDRCEEDTVLKGIVTGNFVVAPGITLELRGIVSGNLTLEASSRAQIHGIVSGNVVNLGGHLEL